MLEIRSSRLSLTASLKSAQLVSNLNLILNSAQFVASRVLIQNALARYNSDGNNTELNWANAQIDMAAAIGGSNAGGVGQALLLQAMVFPGNGSGPAGRYSVLNATGSNIPTITLPNLAPNGSIVHLDDTEYGYPPMLYPNLTYADISINSTYAQPAVIYNGEVLTAPNSTLLLGPYHINTTFSLLSLTLPIVNNTSATDVLGWLTLVCDARIISDVLVAKDGLGETGQVLLVGSTNTTNHFKNGVLWDSPGGVTANPKDVEVQYVWPLPEADRDRHAEAAGKTNAPTFTLNQYPAFAHAFMTNQHIENNAGSIVGARNEEGRKVSVGFAVPNTSLVDWALVIEQSRDEVWQPIAYLRKVLLACVFGTLGVMLLIAWPLAHFASAPIRRLREATRRSIMPAGCSESSCSRNSEELHGISAHGYGVDEAHNAVIARKEGFFATVERWRKKRRQGRRDRREKKEEARRRQFRIPVKVKDRNHCIQDELTDLTRTFNEMSDELMMQYERLEERVQQRTAELELSKKAAEAANESKTLFIANISHELKTPLNGILGMCAVCMQEEDPNKLKRSLGIIYKSGDLLLNLLTDLLTFSKNQVGQQLALDEKDFRLREISSQVKAIFEKQAKEGQIKLVVDYQGTEGNGLIITGEDDRKEYGPFGTGRVKDMILWGDQHRILQVVINLVSNSLKFTPPGGSVVLTIRCLGEAPDAASRKTSFGSKNSKPFSFTRNRSSDASLALPPNKRVEATALEINPMSERYSVAHIMASERSATPPAGRSLLFEFECKDTGPGIAEHLQQRIFEPFVQGDLGLSKKYGGTGLGLSICSQLAGLMHGTIILDSELGRGSTFTMRIPLRHLYNRSDSTASSVVGHDNRLPAEDTRSPKRHSRFINSDDDSRRSMNSRASSRAPSPCTKESQPGYQHDSQPRLVGLSQPFFASNQPMESPGSQPAAMDKIAADAQQSGKIRVLVAEDNKVNQEVVLRMLKLEDIYDVTVAKDGQEALDLVRESMSIPGNHGYNLIFMDVQMPNLDGLQSTRLIRDLGYQAPIVALTAFAEESNVKDCLESGMNYFLSKPIRRPALKKVLKEYCAPIPEERDEDETPTEKRRPAIAEAKLSVSAGANTQNNLTIRQSSRPNSVDLPESRSSAKGVI